MARLTARVQELCGRVDMDHVPAANNHSAGYVMLDGATTSARGPLLSQLWLQPLKGGPDRRRITEALHQTWDWAEAREVASGCTYALTVNDFMATTLNAVQRNRQFRAFLLALHEVAPCKAIHWVNSQLLMEPGKFVALQEMGDVAALYGTINVRFFQLEGNDDDCLMDTLGLGAFGLPDVQCHFCELSPADVAGVLHGTACQMFERGNVWRDGHRVRGIQGDERWQCLHEASLAKPDRIVVDLNPGAPYAAGNRPPAPEADAARTRITIRRALPEDDQALAQVYLASRRAHFHWTNPESFSLADFEHDSAGEVVHLACDNEGKVVGFVSVWELDAFVHLLFIAPGHEGQGIGQQLLDHLATWLPLPHRLKCVVANTAALGFYRRLGWQEVDQGMDGKEPYLLMEKTAVQQKQG